MPVTKEQAEGLVGCCNDLLQKVERYKGIAEEKTKQTVGPFIKMMSSLFAEGSDFYKELVTAGHNMIIGSGHAEEIVEIYEEMCGGVETCKKTLLNLFDAQKSEFDSQVNGLVQRYARFLERSGLKNKNISITINRKDVGLNDLFENYRRYLLVGERDYDHLSVLSDKEIREDVVDQILEKGT